jgi:hypothetical protein
MAKTYALARVEPGADASGLRPEIAPLMDHGLYGSANTALSYFEAHPLPRSLCAALAGLAGSRRRFQLGVHAETDIHVAEDRSADLGLALAFYGASAGVSLDHVVATGSLRRSGDADASSDPSGRVHIVSGLVQKAQLVEGLIARQPSSTVVFVFPATALDGGSNEAAEFSGALDRLRELAKANGVTFTARPVATVQEALGAIAVRRQTGGGAACILAALAVVAASGYFAADWYISRPLALVWSEFNVGGELVPSPSMAEMREGEDKWTVCRVVQGADQIAIVPFGFRMLFFVADAAGELPEKTSMAIVVVSETTPPRVVPVRGARVEVSNGEAVRKIAYSVAYPVEAPSEYTRTMVVARRFGAVNLDRLTDAVSEVFNGAVANSIDAVSNHLRTKYPGYVEYGYRSTNEKVECARY